MHREAAPVEEEKFLTPGVMVMLALMAVGLAFVAKRFLFGIGKVANLNNQFPWGIWIGIDVASGVALAAGGFTTGAIAYVFNRDQYHAVIGPALFESKPVFWIVIELARRLDLGEYFEFTIEDFRQAQLKKLPEVAKTLKEDGVYNIVGHSHGIHEGKPFKTRSKKN